MPGGVEGYEEIVIREYLQTSSDRCIVYGDEPCLRPFSGAHGCDGPAEIRRLAGGIDAEEPDQGIQRSRLLGSPEQNLNVIAADGSDVTDTQRFEDAGISVSRISEYVPHSAVINGPLCHTTFSSKANSRSIRSCCPTGNKGTPARRTNAWTYAIVALPVIFLLQVCRPGVSFCDDSTLLSGGLESGLIVTLTLGKSKVSQGESIPFSITLSHAFENPLSVTSFLDANRSLRITLKGRDGKIHTADQMSHKERDGIAPAGRSTPEGLSLPPGGKLFLRGDLLEWLGTVPAGQYLVDITYTGILRQSRSRPVSLSILPVSIESASVSQCGAQKKNAPVSSAWIRREKNASVIFSRVSSPKVPGNVIHCSEAARPEGKLRKYGAAFIPGPEYPFSAVYWMNDFSDYFFALTGTKLVSAEQPVRVRLPFEADSAGSPLLLPDRTLFAPFLCREKDGFALVKILPSGEPEVHRYAVEGISKAGRKAVFWEEDKVLHLFWLQGKTTLQHAALSLKDLEKGFSAPAAIRTEAEVVHFIPYLDSSIPSETLQSIYLGVGNPVDGIMLPRIKVWCVSIEKNGLSCTQIDVKNGVSAPAFRLKTKKIPGLRVIGSAVTNEYGLALLLKDAKGKLLYGSTMRATAVALNAVTKSRVRLSDCPAVVASRTAPSVYLQYVQKGKALKYIRIEG